MSTYFSIGEIAKMFNVSTQTLRLYDKISLLKPSFINSENGYRYYSINQFVTLDYIKQCKTMGMSLEEIKILIEKDSSIEAMLEITRNQKQIVDNKIKELIEMREQLNSFENKIEEAIEVGFNKIVFIQSEKRNFIKYNYKSVGQEQLEINFRKVILDVEEKYGTLSSNLVLTVSYDNILKYNKVVFEDLSIQISNNIGIKDKNLVEVPSGTYLTMYIKDSSADNRKYYNEMIDFINKNNISVKGDFIETAISARINKDGEENTLSKIEILVNKK